MVLIWIQECSKQADIFYAKVSFDQGSAYEVIVRDPFSKEEEERLEWYFEEHLKFPFTDQVKNQEAAASVITYGERLFEQVFSSEPHIFSSYKAAVLMGVDTLQIEIVGQPSFHALHWEALKDPELPQPLALQATIMRKNLISQAIPTTVCPSPTINLLIITARPRGKRDIGYRTISGPLVEALSQADMPVQMDILHPGTYKALANHLREVTNKHGIGYYHVIHFDVHGSLLTYEEFRIMSRSMRSRRDSRQVIQPYVGLQAFLALESERDGISDLVGAEELAALLTHYQIPIAILNACQSGKQVGEHETSLGSHLMQAGVQTVLAMAYSVTVSAAVLLMRALYQHLFDDNDLKIAIRDARKELYSNKERRAYFDQLIKLEDWLLPVVYQNQPVTLQLREFTPQEHAAWSEREVEQKSCTPSEPTYGFVGRDLDILQIEKCLLTKGNILLVQGMGGSGKTTLLKYIGGWWHITGFVQHVFYFGYDEKAWTLQQIMTTIAQQFYGSRYYTDLQPLSLRAQQVKLVQDLRSANNLLILDNLESITGEHLAIQHTLPKEEQDALHSFLADLTRGKTLVLLGSRGSENWLAKGTFDDNVYVLLGLDSEAATTLANRILERHNVTKYRQDEDLQELVKLLDGFPLAVEVVLANLAHQSPAKVLSALQAGDITLGVGDSQKKTENILRCIEYSHGNLSSEAQALLLCLAPFTSVLISSTLDQYTTYLKQQPLLSVLPFDRWSQVLKEAENWGLLLPDAKIPALLRLHPTLPYFLRTRLHDSERATVLVAVETAFRECYYWIAIAYYKLLISKDSQDRLLGQELMYLEYENLGTALSLALAAQVSISYLYMALSSYLDVKNDAQRGLGLGKSVLERLEAYAPDKMTDQIGKEVIFVIGNIAKRYIWLGQYASAESLYHKSITLLSKNMNLDAETSRREVAISYHQLGRLAKEQQQWDRAEQYYQQALQIFIDSNDFSKQAGTYNNLGIMAQEQRHWDKAEQYHHQALQIFIDTDDNYEQAKTYHYLGGIAHRQRQWDKAEYYYQQALPIFITFKASSLQAGIYQNLGVAAQEQRQWNKAEKYYQQALSIYIDRNDLPQQAMTYGSLGTMAWLQRKWEQAELYYSQSLQIYSKLNNLPEQARVYNNLGVVANEQQQWDKAERYLQQALPIYDNINDLHEQARTYNNFGVVAKGRKQWEQAEQYYQQALQIFIDTDDYYEQAGTYNNLGALAGEQQQWDKAEHYFQQALSIYITLNEYYDQGKAYRHLGIAALKKRNWKQARDLWLRALKIFIASGDTDYTLNACYYLAQIWKSDGDTDLPSIVASIIDINLNETEALLQKMLLNRYKIDLRE